MLRLRFAVVVLVLLCLGGTGGCRVSAGALTPLEAGQLDERVALAEPEGESDPVAHALRLAQSEWALERPDRAADAAGLALRRARAAEWMAGLEADEDGLDGARRQREQTAREARRWARRTDSPSLMAVAVMASAHPRRHRRALRRAIVRMPVPPPGLDVAATLEVAGRHPESRRQIARWTQFDDEEREFLGLDQPGRIAPSHDLAVSELTRALLHQRPSAELREHAERVVALDPWHLGARLLLLGMDEIEAGTLEDDPLLLDDLHAGSSASLGPIARLYLRRRRSTGSWAVALAMAWRMLEADLVGDAQGVLDSLPSDAGPQVGPLRDRLVAMTAALRGDAATFEQWRETHDVRSASLDRWLMDLDERGRSAPVRSLAVEARRRWARRRLPYPDGRIRWSVLLDPGLDDATRQWALDDSPFGSGEQSAWVKICEQRSYDGPACLDLQRYDARVYGVQVAGRTPHFHPEFLSGVAHFTSQELSSLDPVLDHYEQTALAASPEYQQARLLRSLVDGDHAQARAQLEQHGALLPARARTWAWLVVDDLASGALEYEESWRWIPLFDETIEPPTEEFSDVPLLTVDRYLYGMALAHAGRDASALEILMPLLDEFDDAAMTQGLAQASLAAHRSGDATRRDELRLRLHAVDPHGVAHARLQATISAGADRIDEARRFLAHALRWHPDDPRLFSATIELLGDAPSVPEAAALTFLAEGPSDVDRFLRKEIRRGTQSDWATAQQVYVALEGTPEQAWALDTAVLAGFPDLADKAARWGIGQLSEAADLQQALHWGGLTLALLEGVGPDGAWLRRQHVWLAMLMGRAEAGLAMADLEDRAVGIVPMGQAESIRLLLRARRAGEIDDVLAWDLWRWFQGDEGATARVRALFVDPPHGTILQDFACGELTTDEELAAAFEVCAQAQRDQPESLSIAVSEAFLALNHPEPATGEAMAARVFDGTIAAPRFEDEPGLADRGNLAQPWHQNHALWLGERGEHQAAAMAWWQAYALGLDDEGGLHQGYAQLRWRGALVRGLQNPREETPRDLDIRRSIMALVGAEPIAARGYAESARAWVPAEPGTLDRSELMFPDRLRHLADWAEADMAEGTLDAASLAEAIDLILTAELPRAQALHEANPHSSLATLALLLAHESLDDLRPVGPLAETLLERHPEDPLAVAAVLPSLIAAGQDERARTLYEQSQASHPRDAMLLYANAPESITGPRDGVPAWVRDPAAFDERVAKVTDAEVDGLVPTRFASDERAAEVFVPRGWRPVEERPLRFIDDHGARMLVLGSPRASRCQGADCARDLLAGVAGQGRTKQWMRQTTLAGLPATQALFTNAEEVLVAWVLPSGGRVLTVVVAGTVERFDALRPAMVMMRDGFRPLDAVLPAFPAESLRAAGPTLRDGWRFEGRREQSRHPGEACPVADTLGRLPHSHQHAELLVDLWLATPEDEGRRALLRCTQPDGASARRLALVSLLDEDPRAHAFGLRAVSHHASRVVADARTVLSTPLTPPVAAPDYLLRTDLPAHGLVEVIAALPAVHAGRLVERLLASKDARDVTMAWAALRLRPELVTDAALDRALAGEPRLVTSAAFLLSDRGEPADAERLRAVLEELPPAGDEPSQSVLRSVTVSLATFLDPRDEPRLRTAARRVDDGDDPERAKRLRTLLDEVAADHERARALAADPSLKPDDDDERALRWGNDRRRRELPRRRESELAGKALAEVLPGRDWTFARLAAPSLFASTVADVAKRLTSGDDAIDQRLGEITSGMLRDGGFAALSGSGGIDTSRPIECAQPFDDNGWLCTAQVTDRDALLAVLGQRASGDDAGVSVPINVATTAGFVPVALSLLPAILHPFVYPGDDDDDDDEVENVQDATERVRMEIEVGGMTLQHYSIVDARTQRIGIDSERYLFVDDRLWVFSTDGTMERVLRRDEQAPLSEDSEFRRLTASWQDGAALQAVSLGRAWPLAEGGASMEVVLDESGLDFRYAGAFESEEGVRDIAPALAQLPEGAVTVFAHGLGGASAFDEALEAEDGDAGRVPPMPVLAHAKGLAFGWYLEDGDRLWRRWLAVAPLDDDLRTRLRKAKTPPGRGRSRRHGGLCYHDRAGYLLVGDCGLVDRSAAGPPAPAVSATHLQVAHGTFDGRAAADRLPGLGGLPLEQKALMRAVAPLLGIFTEMSVRADWIPAERTAVLEGHVGLQLRPAGDRTRVIDDWLAASEGRNAATLPRRLRSDEIESPLRYRIEVPDAEDFVRNTVADSQRISAEVVDDTHVVLTVAPVPGAPTPVPLTDKERKNATEKTATFRIDDPAIVEVAQKLAPEGTSPQAAAEAMAQWVHQRLTYEVTPRSLDGATILEAGRGDCTEYATLTVTLLRAAGVPAQMRDGMAASGDELVAHAWVAYHDGERWREIDPTWGRDTASAGHLEMSVLDALALISLGRLTVVEISGVP